MYYRVGAFYKSENARAIVVKARDIQQVKERIPSIAEMIWPEERREGLEVKITLNAITSNFAMPLLSDREFYGIVLRRPTQGGEEAFEEPFEPENFLSADVVIRADHIDEAKAQFVQTYRAYYTNERAPEECDVYAEEISVETALEDQYLKLKDHLIGRYASPEAKGMLYEGMKALLDHLKMTEYLDKELDASKLSHAEFCRICNELCAAEIGKKRMEILNEAKEKYGKAVEA